MRGGRLTVRERARPRGRAGLHGPIRPAVWALPSTRSRSSAARPKRSKGPGGPELALRKYLDDGLYPQVPTKFWRLVAAAETHAFFASGRLEQGLFWLAVQFVEGQWRVVGTLDECRRADGA